MKMENTINFFKAIGHIAVYLCITVFLQAFYLALDIEKAVAGNILLIFAGVVATGYVVYEFRNNLTKDIDDFKKNFKKYTKKAFSNWVVGFTLMFLANVLLITLLKGIAPNEEANREMMDSFFAYTVVYVVVLAPIAEELLFRANFKKCFKNKKFFVMVTAFLFGMLHVVTSMENIYDLLYFIPYMALGYAFSKTYIETDNVYPSIMVHMFHNLLSVLLIVFEL